MTDESGGLPAARVEWDAEWWDAIRVAEFVPVFREGDNLRLVDAYGMSAPVGAVAVVTQDYFATEQYVRVEWLTDSNGQKDGGYWPDCFERITPLASDDPRAAPPAAPRTGAGR